MEEAKTDGMKRRDFLGAATLLALALGLPLAAARLAALPNNEVPSDRQRLLLKDVSQIVIPRTVTAGAGDVGAGDFVILALAHGLEKSRVPLPLSAPVSLLLHRRTDGSLDHVRWLEEALDRGSGGDWFKAAADRRSAALSELDSAAFAEGVKDHPWRTVKGLILTGYYTSQVGGAQELRFELVPGRFDPDLPVTPETRAYSSDWTAVDFG